MADEIIYERNSNKYSNTVKISKAVQLIHQIESQYPAYNSIILAVEDSRSVAHILMLQEQYGFIFVIEPYKDRRRKKVWQDLLVHPDVTVTIDLFHFGLIVSRKEQTKENFRLRFPYFNS